MSDAEILDGVKKGLGITGTFHDERLLIWIEATRSLMLDSGVDETRLNARESLGCIIRGVSDLSENGDFSMYFKMRLIQLATGGHADV